LQGLFDEGILSVIEAHQRAQLAQAQAKFDDDDLDGASEILADRAFEIQTDVDVVTLGTQIDAAKAAIAEQAERDTEAGGYLFDADQALDSNDFAAAKEALANASAAKPQRNALAQYQELSEQYDAKVAEAKSKIHAAITSCAPEAASDLEGALALVPALKKIEALSAKDVKAYTKVLNALKGLKEGTGNREDHLEALEVQAIRLKPIKADIEAARQRFEAYKPAPKGGSAAAAAAAPKAEAAARAARPPSPEGEPRMVTVSRFDELSRKGKADYKALMLDFFQDPDNNDLILLEQLFTQFTSKDFTHLEDNLVLTDLLDQRRAAVEARLQKLLVTGNWKAAEGMIEQLHGANAAFVAQLHAQIQGFKLGKDETLTAQVLKVSGGAPASGAAAAALPLAAAPAEEAPAPAAVLPPAAAAAAPEVDVPALESRVLDAIGALKFADADAFLGQLSKTDSTNVAGFTEMLRAAREEDQEGHQRAFRSRSESRLERVESQPEVVIAPAAAAAVALPPAPAAEAPAPVAEAQPPASAEVAPAAAAPTADVTVLEESVEANIVAGEFARAEQLLAALERTSSTRVADFRNTISAMRDADQAELAAMQQDKSPSSTGSASGSDGEGGTQGAPPMYVQSVYDMQDKMDTTRAAAPKADAPQTPASADAAPKRGLPKRPVKAAAKGQGAARPKGAPKKAVAAGPKVPAAATADAAAGAASAIDEGQIRLQINEAMRWTTRTMPTKKRVIAERLQGFLRMEDLSDDLSGLLAQAIGKFQEVWGEDLTQD